MAKQTKLTNLTTNDQTIVIDAGRGTFHSLVVVLVGETSQVGPQSGTFDVTLYDHASSATGTVLARWGVGISDPFKLDLDYKNGLTLGVRAGTSAVGTLIVTFS